MKFLLSTIILPLTLSLYAQPISKMNDCAFFDLIDKLLASQPDDPEMYSVRNDWSSRREMLQRLETYLIVFGKDEIAPMHLADSDPLRCPEHVESYKLFLTDSASQKGKYKARDSVQKTRYRNIMPLLLKLTDLENSKGGDVEKALSEFQLGFTVEYLYQHVKPKYEAHLWPAMSSSIMERNLQLLIQRMNKLDQTNYMYYTSYSSKSLILKGFEAYHDNDVLMLTKGMNQDREYTGGFKFIAVTDYLKWRWLRISCWSWLGLGCKIQDDVLTYQTVSLGGSGFTPYIRYRNNFELADTLHRNDRPFASNFYWERAKHRTWRKGLVRHRGEFQVGAIGISQGRKIQAQLHEDVIHESQFVYGWDKQIADGGRLFLQANHKLDLLLFSASNQYQTVFKPNTIRIKAPENYWGANVIGELEVKTGTLSTSAGVGIRFSTLDLLKQSGNNMIVSNPRARRDAFGWKFDIGLNYRYVKHNSMLEGIGWLNTFPEDEYDIVRPDYHVLQKNEIERNLFILDFGLNLKWRKTTVFFRQTFHNLEYRSRLENLDFQASEITARIDPLDITFYNDKVIVEQNAFLDRKFFGKVFYGYGTIGASWIIE